MKAESSSAAGGGDINHTTPPLVWILDNDTNLDDWLTAHPPNRLGVPAAFNNGKPAMPIWVLAVKSIDQISELADDATIAKDKTFTKARQLMQTAAAQVERIQQDDEIPIRPSGKMSMNKSKKQCRTEVQNTFHEQIMLMATDHPLWDQGRWTMLVKPSEIDCTFALLAKSLASGDLSKQGNVVALRARMLPFSESTYDINNNGPKRKKSISSSSSRRSNSRSPTSARHANDQPLGIDIFFRRAWSSTEARNVLQAVAEASGRMASFCKSSLYSRLGINSNHALGVHASLYNSKTLATPADSKAWVGKHHHGAAALAGAEPQSQSSLEAAAGPSSKVVASFSLNTIPFSSQNRAKEGSFKRELEVKPGDVAGTKDEEPASKKPRNGVASEGQVAIAEQKPAQFSGSSFASSMETQESQDEPMLPLRPIPHPQPGKFMNQTVLDPVVEEKSAVESQEGKKEIPREPMDVPSLKVQSAMQGIEDESQTQIEPMPVKEDMVADQQRVTEQAPIVPKSDNTRVEKDIEMEAAPTSTDKATDIAELKPTATQGTAEIESEDSKQSTSSALVSKGVSGTVESGQAVQPPPLAAKDEDVKASNDKDVQMEAAPFSRDDTSGFSESKQTTARKMAELPGISFEIPLYSYFAGDTTSRIDLGEQVAAEPSDDKDAKMETVLQSSDAAITITEGKSSAAEGASKVESEAFKELPSSVGLQKEATGMSGEKTGEAKEDANPVQVSGVSKAKNEEDTPAIVEASKEQGPVGTSSPDIANKEIEGGKQAQAETEKSTGGNPTEDAKVAPEPLKTAAEQASQDIAAHISEGVSNIVQAAQSTISPDAVTQKDADTKTGDASLDLPKSSQKETNVGPIAETAAAADKSESQHSVPEMSLEDLIVEGATASPTNENAQPVANDEATK